MASPQPTLVEESLQAAAPEVQQAKGLEDQTNYVPIRKIVSIFVSCAITEFTTLLDETMIAVALPQISSELGGGNQIAWVATSYFVTSTSFQLVCGRLSDIWSRKTVLFVLMVIFSIGNLRRGFRHGLCGTVGFQSGMSSCLSALRALFLLLVSQIAGIGGGGIPTIAQVIVSDTVSLRDRGKYQGILGAAVALSYGVGPVIGGAIVERTTWRWIFRLLLPLTAFSAVCCYFFMPLKPVESNWRVKLRRIDFMGSFLVLGSSMLIVMALTWGGSSYPWDNAHVLATGCIGIVLGIAFIVWEGKWPKYPLLPLYIFRQRIVIGAAVTHFINGYLTMVQVFYVPSFYQLAYGYSPTKSAAFMLTLTVMQTFMSSFSGLVISWTGRYRELILTGWAVWAVGLGLFSTLDENSSVARQVGYSLLAGFGVGQTLQPSLVAVQGAVERKDMAVVTATRSFVRNIGGTFGLAISGTLLTNIFMSNLDRVSSEANLDPLIREKLRENPLAARTLVTDPDQLALIVDGYREGFWVIFVIMASLASVAFVFTAVFMTHSSLKRDDDEKLKREARERLEREKTGSTGSV
ncbi:hypothetical protein AAF712_008826 [Marasmius tenuissimus]|uniref:Major facilitator superfamily (MFS) profile domain-containing protein n=1 Tax=Marasmius tenuissimus TaxID=585030 RepID=A0ABR2ZRN2_9AGAR